MGQKTNHTPFAKKILKTIEEKNIHPKPRWQILFSRGVVWGVATATFILGSLSISIALRISLVNDIPFLARRFYPLTELAKAVPYLWILLAVICVIYTTHAIHQTRKGYRWSTSWLVLGGLATGTAIGLFLFSIGAARSVDSLFYRHLPYYHQLSGYRVDLWVLPEKGILGGTISSSSSTTKGIKLIDFNGTEWEVDLNEAIISPRLKLEPGRYVRAIGSLESEREKNKKSTQATTTGTTTRCFKADELRPWNGPKIRHKGKIHRHR